jgi:uncharacterized protein (TIGR00661 family)
MGLKQYNIDAINPLFTEDDIVIFGVLNWGLGHAARCIPIIKWLQQRSKKVIIASDGVALKFLQLNFPQGNFEILPSYGINYKYENIVLNIATSSFSILKATLQERRIIKELAKKYQATKVVSDNRLGLYTADCPSFYITHQVNILHHNKLLSFLGTRAHRMFYQQFDKILIPDFKGKNSLGGQLSQISDAKAFYLGPLTRINKIETEKTIDVLVMLSGPEPQRTIIENELLNELNGLESLKIRFIRGTNNKLHVKNNIKSHIEITNISSTQETETLLNSCKLLISRSGFTTIMDTYELEIPTIWIPTPGQTEQEYLAQIHVNITNQIKLNQKELNKLQKIIISMI